MGDGPAEKAEPAADLSRGLGLLSVFCIASGAMISSGLFVLPGIAHAAAGPAVIVSYALAGVLAVTGMLSIAELTTAMPRAGGDYFFISRGMGPAVGTVSGLLSWFSLTLKSAFALVGLMAFVQLVVDIPEGQEFLVTRTVGLLLCAGFVGLNLVGVKEAARLQVALVMTLFGLMVVYVVKGVPAVEVRRFEPFVPYGPRSVFATAGLVFVAYGGLLNVASVAEETRNPARTIPLGIILSLLAALAAYVLMVFVTSGVLDHEVLDNSLTPISLGGQALMGRAGLILMSGAAVAAFLTTANAGIMSASRYLLALSRDRMLPPLVGRVNERFQTPHVAVLITGALAAVSLFVTLRILVEAASIVFMLTFMLSSLSVIVLRESGVQNYRPSFRAPLYPWLQIGGILALLFVVFEMGEEAFAILAVLILAGFSAYWFYGRRSVQQESALLHLLQRLTARELVTGTLEAELKDVIRQRDEVVLDRFDRLIEDCPVIDVEEPIDRDDLFERIAENLAERVDVDAEHLAAELRRREEESSTVISPDLALPHVVIEGEHTFDILLARCREGVRFSDRAPRLRAVFVLVGTRDERTFHLRALSAIAQIAGSPGFIDDWMRAAGPQQLRDMVLLGKRARNEAT
ncbi:MAG: amino acid permease [Planctomycetota bacterium]